MIWTLEVSLNFDDWRVFLVVFQDILRSVIKAETTEEMTEEDIEKVYYECLRLLKGTLSRYRDYITDNVE